MTLPTKPLAGNSRRRLWLLGWLPYLALVVIIIILIRGGVQSIDSFWWIALTVVVISIIISLVLFGTHLYRQRQASQQTHLTERLRAELLLLLDLSPKLQHQHLSVLFSRLSDVHQASGNFTATEKQSLRTALNEAGATQYLLSQVRKHRVNQKTIILLGWLTDEAALLTLQVVLQDQDSDCAYLAGQSIAQYHSSSAYKILLRALKLEWLQRSRVAGLIENSQCEEIIPLLLEYEYDSEPQMRFWITYLLGRSGIEAASPALKRLAQDPNLDVRANAATALGEFSGTAQTIKKMLSDPEWVVQAHAAKAVGEGRYTKLAPELVKLLSSQSWWVRENATLALKALGSTTIPSVRRALDSDDRFVCNKSAEILNDLGYTTQQVAYLGNRFKRRRAQKNLLAIGRAGGMATLRANLTTIPSEIQVQLKKILTQLDTTKIRREK